MHCGVTGLSENIGRITRSICVLIIRLADRVGQDADPKEGRKKYLTGKKYFVIRVLLEKKKKKLPIYIAYILYIYMYDFGAVTFKAERSKCR